MNKRLLLISSSLVHGFDYLDHPEAEIKDFLAGIRRVLFVPYATRDRGAYAARARERLGRMGFDVASVHEAADPAAAVAEAQALFIGGGNTFRLLKALYETSLLEPIRKRVGAGMPYIGSSAGTNVACPTIRTSNDMPIVEPPSLTALGLVPFQINPHYQDPDPASTHQGETRQERILEFLEENDEPVVALREGSMLRIEGPRASLKGTVGARVFRRGAAPAEVKPGESINTLIK